MESFLARFVALWTRARVRARGRALARQRGAGLLRARALQRRRPGGAAQALRQRTAAAPATEGVRRPRWRPARSTCTRATRRFLAHAPRPARSRRAERAHRRAARRPKA